MTVKPSYEIRDTQIVGLSSLSKAILSLIASYTSLSSLTEAIFQRVSKWGSLSFPMTAFVISIRKSLNRGSQVPDFQTQDCIVMRDQDLEGSPLEKSQSPNFQISEFHF